MTSPISYGARRADVLGEQDELLGALQPDQPGEQPRAQTVGGEGPPGEHLDELGVLGHDHQVAGEGEVGADAGRGALHLGDHRHLAVEDRVDRA